MEKHNGDSYSRSSFKFLGKGHNGEVYLLPDGKVVKISYNDKNLYKEYDILKRVNGNKYFPKVYEIGSNYMIRDYVAGEMLTKYIKRNGLNEELTHEIIDMLKEFKELKFKKIDIRCKDIFVQPDGTLKVIDPKKCYCVQRAFPRHLSKGLYKLKVLDYFLDGLKEYDNKLYKRWNKNIKSYIREIKDYVK